MVVTHDSCGSHNVAVGLLAASRGQFLSVLSFHQFLRRCHCCCHSVSTRRRLSPLCSTVYLIPWRFFCTLLLTDTFQQSCLSTDRGVCSKMWRRKCQENLPRTAELYLGGVNQSHFHYYISFFKCDCHPEQVPPPS